MDKTDKRNAAEGEYSPVQGIKPVPSARENNKRLAAEGLIMDYAGNEYDAYELPEGFLTLASEENGELTYILAGDSPQLVLAAGDILICVRQREFDTAGVYAIKTPAGIVAAMLVTDAGSDVIEGKAVEARRYYE